MEDIKLIASPLTLPNGVEVPNRLVKVAMAEGIGLGGGPPTPEHDILYMRWVAGGWGIVITGNVQINPKHLASPYDLTIDPTSASHKSRYMHLALMAHFTPDRPLMIMQLSHPGLQSSSTLNCSRAPWEPAIAPCSERPTMGGGVLGKVWQYVGWPVKSRKVSDVGEWLAIVERFVEASVMAGDAGWDGVQVHAAHGYLLSSFMSPLTNFDPLPLPGVPEDVPLNLHLLYLILKGLKEQTAEFFIKAVKINCSDFVQGGLDEEQASDIIRAIVSWNLVDIIEISGGTYTNPAFTFSSSISSTTSKRQSLFAHFTSKLLPTLPPPPKGPAILLTGGLHDRWVIADSLRERACDLAGIGRPACLIPDLPDRVLLNPDVPGKFTHVGGYTIPKGDLAKIMLGGSKKEGKGIPLVGAGVSTLWHTWQLRRMGRGIEPDKKLTWFKGLVQEEIWEGLVVRGWRRVRGTRSEVYQKVQLG
ncbi:NADH:flavin oxidoreductase/NADH oxidase [Cryptococcus wingfieldii CBS 7118]|uniref:NADH:flavin oxidoreductase/NADH oxidase n=1 Tax=Cryptococcus wingfieldii CBS 7118 TaxID=1295528 RepID=A0A1E3K2Q1_9TREE|nr:NADH:flavin oxidoreductase/NADH oxidase [Cryptococcus wingfieldii CBS 7118]ODO07291.1 NADH:flavin oxidoreductase/NADH oxidase [Cryptococcus wingfieldii CBS 7118]